jgi:hypothetical protein
MSVPFFDPDCGGCDEDGIPRVRDEGHVVDLALGLIIARQRRRAAALFAMPS